jgi:hypothetical protein
MIAAAQARGFETPIPHGSLARYVIIETSNKDSTEISLMRMLSAGAQGWRR